MKQTKVTAADVEQFRQSLPEAGLPAVPLHQEVLTIDGIAFTLVRRSESDDARTNTYSIGFRCGESDYVLIVRPTLHEVPSITLNIMRKAPDHRGETEFASHTLLKDTITTLKGQVSELAKADIAQNFDFAALLKHLKVHDE